jgi:hypothetical protein
LLIDVVMAMYLWVICKSEISLLRGGINWILCDDDGRAFEILTILLVIEDKELHICNINWVIKELPVDIPPFS